MIKRQALSYIWSLGFPLAITGLIQGLLLVLSVKLPDYPSNSQTRAILLLVWLVITMIEIVVATVLGLVIFIFSVLIGKQTLLTKNFRVDLNKTH